jgi:hypothetical protein
MANEITVVEMAGLRADVPIYTAPFLKTQVLSLSGASVAFTPSTNSIAVVTTVDCKIEISAAPTASTIYFPMIANVMKEFSVVSGHKIIGVS